jgi:hypothetical protein
MLSAVDEYVAENSRAHNCSYRDVVAVIYMHALVCHALRAHIYSKFVDF